MNGHKPLGVVTGSVIKIVKFLAKILRSLPWIDMLKATSGLIPSGKWLKPLPVVFQVNIKWTIRT